MASTDSGGFRGWLARLAWVTVACLGAWYSRAAVPAAARGVVMSLYSPDKSLRTLAGVVRIQRLATDSRRLGFFRVRAFPVVMADGVQLEVVQTGDARRVLAEFCRNLGSTSRGLPLEIKDLQIAFAGEPVPRLQAHRATLVRRETNAFLTLEHVTLTAGSNRISVARAQLGAAGQPAGAVHWQKGGVALTYDLATAQFLTNRLNRASSPL